MPAPRTILHVDMDAFFASVEQRDHPELAGRPVLVGGAGRRGVVAAASYEARRFGCHSAQPMAVALRRCPDAVVVPPRGRAYREASDHVFQLFHQVTPLVEPLSIDEAFLDVTGSERLAGTGREIAERLRAQIEADLSLTASVGVAPNKFLAKLASDMDKPDGLTEIPEDRIDAVLLPLPVRRIPGIGPSAEQRLSRMGIHTVADVRAEGRETLVARLGVHGERLFELAHGRDARFVVPDARAKSISQECTFPVDLADPDEVRAVLVRHVESVARRVRRNGFRAGVVQIKVRYGAFETITRSKTLAQPTDATSEFLGAADRLFGAWAADGFRPVRLIGFGASRLVDADAQMQLFQDRVAERARRLDRAVDALTERFGHRAIGRATGALRDDERADGFEHEEGLDRRDA
ncbi:MAG: DNA polymerase IV [Planctomycetota bacterium]|nr:DNA polymerase IV [Planctomycetota bacterium]